MIPDVALLHVTSCTQDSTVSYRLCVMIMKIFVEILHFTVYCAMRMNVVITREESWEIMAEWVMLTPFNAHWTVHCTVEVFNVNFADYNAKSITYKWHFFSFSTWCKLLASDIRFKWRLASWVNNLAQRIMFHLLQALQKDGSNFCEIFISYIIYNCQPCERVLNSSYARSHTNTYEVKLEKSVR